ncbi:MAG: DedA family protein [Deltaproteobacteria bacterium]|nr:DedA family protein [Deltaproteobacteria bacterium]MBW1987746.1 DedA family protein [Deltaproteobacteria bacterium]MBW2135700.1 DedA family protein [Deltaproteobacteria bacterium]
MDWYTLLIQKYGYLAIFLGSLVEGEIFLILGGLLARQGLLNLWLVVSLAVVGSFSSHGGFYLLGRWQGQSLVGQFQRLQAGYPRAQALAQRFGPACIFVVQYLYGLRLITSLTLGTLGIPARVFILWQIFSISCWAVGLATAGYLFGKAIEYFITRLEILLSLVLVTAALGIWAYSRLWHWARTKSAPLSPHPPSSLKNPTRNHLQVENSQANSEFPSDHIS